MKKRKLFLIGLLIWNFISVFSQSQLCGTPQSINPTVYPLQDNSIQAKSSSSAICINVYFHIVRNSNGSNAFSQPNLDLIIERLNEFYSPRNIIINNGGFGYINNSSLLDITVDEAKSINNTENKNSFINYYIVQDMDYNGFALGAPSNALFIRLSRIYTSTSAHELGHCLGLYHTHKGLAYDEAGCAEAINGSNCNTCGDLVCDTPADNGEVNTKGYTPDLTNIMSYFHLYGYDRNHFTNGQGYRMRYAIQNESILENIISNNCSIPEITGSSTICGSTIKTYTLKNANPNATTDWQLSPNLYRIGANNTSIGIRPLNSYNSGSGWVSAYQSGKKVATKNIWLNRPLTGMKRYCEDVTQTMCYLSGATSQVQAGSHTTFALVTKGNVNQANYTDWEWQKSSGNFTFVSGSGGNPVNNGQGSLGRYATLQVNGSGLLMFKARTRNECGWGNWKYFFWNVYAYSSYYRSINSLETTTGNAMKIPVKVDYFLNNKQLKVEILNENKWLQAKYGNTELNERDMQKIIRLVETKDNTVNISIYNFTGERVLNKKITNAKGTISLSQLRSGIHFVKTTMKGLTETKTIYLLR